MHGDELPIDIVLVRRLLAEQLPHLAGRPLAMVRSTGTVNAICRIGNDLSVRLPRVAGWASDLTRELEWLPRLAPLLSLPIPTPVAEGRPTSWYPYPWAVYRWLDGSPYEEALVRDERETARDLAGFIRELRRIDIAGAPRGGRAPLRDLSDATISAMKGSGDRIDVTAALAAWSRSTQTRPWDGNPVWIHGDLLPSNLLVKGGRLCAVIDFGGAGIGDPAADVVPAWSVFSRVGREAFREALDVDDDTWARARGYALHQAALIIPYYPRTNPAFVAMAERTVAEVLADP